jgi:hypothetical protein
MSRRYLALWLPHPATDHGYAAPGPLVTPRTTQGKTHALCPRRAIETASRVRRTHALLRLAGWCHRYSQLVAVDGRDGLMLDITSIDEPLDGEAALLADIVKQIEGFGFHARAAVAPTPGAAWALARHAGGGTIAPDHGSLPDLLGPLPVRHLRFRDEAVSRLVQAGLPQVSDLLALAPADIARRFGGCVVRRLDQALGHQAEWIIPVRRPAALRLRLNWAKPLNHGEDLRAAADHLAGQLQEVLASKTRDAADICLSWYGTDGHVCHADQPVSMSTRHLLSLVRGLAGKLALACRGRSTETLILSVRQLVPIANPRQACWFEAAEVGSFGAAYAHRSPGLRQAEWSAGSAISRFTPRPTAGVNENAPPSYQASWPPHLVLLQRPSASELSHTPFGVWPRPSIRAHGERPATLLVAKRDHQETTTIAAVR